MKKLLFLFLLFCSCLTGLATVESNMLPLAFPDSLVKQRVCYKDPGAVGQNLQWDFSLLHILEDEYSVVHFLSDSVDNSVICGKEHHTRYYYSLAHDTLYSIGYEDENTIMHYSAPEIVSLLPIHYGNQVQSYFEGAGLYGHLLPMRIEGYSIWTVDAEGSLILPDGRHDNVLRTHNRRHYAVSGIDTTPMTVDSYKWYTTECPYPIFESLIATSQMSDSLGNQRMDTVLQTSFYYSAEVHDVPTMSDGNIDITVGETSVFNIFSSASFLPNPVESDLHVSYMLSRDAEIGYSIHHASGLPILTVPAVRKTAGEHLDILSMSGCNRGAYTLFVFVDGYVLQEVIIKK